MTATPAMMRAVVLDAPGPPESLHIRDLRIPTAATGEVLIKVEAFGLNRSELHTRLGLAEGVTFPRGSPSRQPERSSSTRGQS